MTSDYDYVQFLREIWLDSLSGGSKGERAYRHYTAEVSCGKFMNTLLLLTLRKASKLEAFNWDIRVELSGQVYKALHQIPALKRVHIRLNPGGSSYAAPPPLPSKADALASSDKPDAPVVVGNVTFYSPKVGSTPGKDAAKTKAPSGPKTIAGFRNLETLEILDMDSLSYVDEIRLAIENSNGTLKKLKLGFAESLARQARKPPPSISSPDDSEPELDEFVNMAPPPPPPPIASTPDDGVLGSAKALIAAESKKLQEAVLGEVFGIAEPQATEESSAESAVKDGDDKKKEQFERMGSQFVVDLLQVSKKLMAATSGGQRTQSQKDALEMIEKAAKKYVEEKKEEEAEKAKKLSEEAEKSKDITEGEATEASPTVAADGADSSVATKDDAKSDDAEPVKEEAGLFDNIEKKPAKSSAATGDGENPEDIDIEAPDVVMDEKESDDQSLSVLPTNVAHESPENTSTEKTTVKHDSILAKLPEEQVAAGQVSPDQKQDVAEKDVNEVMAQLKEALDKRDIQKAIDCFSLWQAIQASSSATEKPADLDISQKAIGDYIRESRGLQLTDLSIYLIPIKASVLSKAVDLRCLKHISLLNVGPQTAFWLQMSKENAISPLPLHEIQTDNVTTAFLNFVGSLDKVTELFLLERKSNIPEYSFAPKTTVTSRHIRRLALKKHWGTLKRLVIRDERDRDFSWDANAKFIETLCLRGKALEELGISFNSTVVVSFYSGPHLSIILTQCSAHSTAILTWPDKPLRSSYHLVS